MTVVSFDAKAPTHYRDINVNGARLRVSIKGQGQPLLLIMGIGASMELWAPFEQVMVPRGFQLIAFDLPGAGATRPTFPPKRMGGLAKIAIGVLDELGLEQADVLGVSFGGVVAQEMGRIAPDRVRRLVLAATAPGIGGVPGNPRVLIHMITPFRYWSKAYARRIAGKLYGGAARNMPKNHPMFAQRFMRPPSIYGYLTQMFAISGWSSMLWLHRMHTKTLILAGNDDPIIPLFNGKLMAAIAPNARLHVVDGGGHLFLLNRTEEMAAIVDQFLREG